VLTPVCPRQALFSSRPVNIVMNTRFFMMINFFAALWVGWMVATIDFMDRGLGTSFFTDGCHPLSLYTGGQEGKMLDFALIDTTGRGHGSCEENAGWFPQRHTEKPGHLAL
jgi:hypothetical protein